MAAGNRRFAGEYAVTESGELPAQTAPSLMKSGAGGFFLDVSRQPVADRRQHLDGHLRKYEIHGVTWIWRYHGRARWGCADTRRSGIASTRWVRGLRARPCAGCEASLASLSSFYGVG